MTMSDVLLQKLTGPVRGRPFEKGRSGNPAGRRPGGPPSEDQNTLQAARRARDRMTQACRTCRANRFGSRPVQLALSPEQVIPLLRNFQCTGTLTTVKL